MAADTFTITLFSDVHCDKFNNTFTSFTNSLPIPIDISSGRYEVGLVEIGFQSEVVPKVKEITPIAPPPPTPSNDTISPQNIQIWWKETIQNLFTYADRKSLIGLISYINEALEKEKRFSLTIFEELLDREILKFKVVFRWDGDHWLEITPEFAQLIGFTDTKIPEGEHIGAPVDASIYDKLGKPGGVEINVCRYHPTTVVTKPIQPGFVDFIDKWEEAINIPQVSFVLLYEYSGDLVFLEVNLNEGFEKMQLSPKMNQLMNLPDEYVFDHTILLSFPISNFVPVPPVPPPTPIIVDPNKFVYISCDIVEQQVCGASLLPVLKVLPRNKDKTFVQQRFEPVTFLPSLRQLVNSVTVCISSRNMQPLPVTKESTYCILSFKLAV